MRKLPAPFAVLLLAFTGRSSADIALLNTSSGEWRLQAASFSERYVDINADWRSSRAVSVTVGIDHKLQLPLRAAFFLVTSEGLYYRTSRKIVVNNRPQTVLLDITDGSPSWYPVGHARPWSALNLTRITRFGVSLVAPAPVSVEVSVSGARLIDADAPADKLPAAVNAAAVCSLRVLRLRDSLVALDFAAAGSMENAFAPAHAPIIT
ncbi:MAG TPA: hypothetical protein ENN09_04765, partial [Planctomycetes bacterium]|nr:hypothetical protein [Planctomycetota bacterium]